MKNTDFDQNEIDKIKEKIRLDEREFGDWFRGFCPAEMLSSVVDGAMTCHCCKYNSGRDTFKDRCFILNLRKEIS